MSVLSTIARHEADFVATQGYPCCKSIIIHRNRLNEYQYRKEIKILKEKGLIKFRRWIEHDESEYTFVQGWYLTDKGTETPEYQRACDDVNERMLKVFGFEPYKKEVQNG